MHYRRPRTRGETFFFTVATHNHRPVLCEPSRILSMRDALADVGKRLPFSVNAFVLLPDHLHCIWTLPENDNDFRVRWAEIQRRFPGGSRAPDKSRSGSGMETTGEFWEPGVNEHPIMDDLDFVHHVEYIHYNPVQHGLAKRPLSWPHSSFRCYVRSGLYLPEWGSEQHRVFLDTIKDV